MPSDFLCHTGTRIGRIASYYERDGRIISIYDSVTLVIIVALVVLLFLTEMQELSFITGLVVGMLIIRIFFHRFNKTASSRACSRNISSAKENYVVRDPGRPRPGLAWRGKKSS